MKDLVKCACGRGWHGASSRMCSKCAAEKGAAARKANVNRAFNPKFSGGKRC